MRAQWVEQGSSNLRVSQFDSQSPHLINEMTGYICNITDEDNKLMVFFILHY